MKRRALQMALLLCAGFVFATTGISLRHRRRWNELSLPVYGALSDFALVDQDGRPFTVERVRGAITIIDFIYTACPDVCPLLSEQMAKIQERTRAGAPSVRLLSISVDPERDTPDALRAYARKFHADLDRWAFVTGPLEMVRQLVVNGFMTAMEGKGPATLLEITHGENFVIVDRLGRIRAFRHARNEAELEEILAVVRALSNEKPADLG